MLQDCLVVKALALESGDWGLALLSPEWPRVSELTLLHLSSLSENGPGASFLSIYFFQITTLLGHELSAVMFVWCLKEEALILFWASK